MPIHNSFLNQLLEQICNSTPNIAGLKEIIAQFTQHVKEKQLQRTNALAAYKMALKSEFNKVKTDIELNIQSAYHFEQSLIQLQTHTESLEPHCVNAFFSQLSLTSITARQLTQRLELGRMIQRQLSDYTEEHSSIKVRFAHISDLINQSKIYNSFIILIKLVHPNPVQMRLDAFIHSLIEQCMAIMGCQSLEALMMQLKQLDTQFQRAIYQHRTSLENRYQSYLTKKQAIVRHYRHLRRLPKAIDQVAYPTQQSPGVLPWPIRQILFRTQVSKREICCLLATLWHRCLVNIMQHTNDCARTQYRAVVTYLDGILNQLIAQSTDDNTIQLMAYAFVIYRNLITYLHRFDQYNRLFQYMGSRYQQTAFKLCVIAFRCLHNRSDTLIHSLHRFLRCANHVRQYTQAHVFSCFDIGRHELHRSMAAASKMPSYQSTPSHRHIIHQLDTQMAIEMASIDRHTRAVALIDTPQSTIRFNVIAHFYIGIIKHHRIVPAVFEHIDICMTDLQQLVTQHNTQIIQLIQSHLIAYLLNRYTNNNHPTHRYCIQILAIFNSQQLMQAIEPYLHNPSQYSRTGFDQCLYSAINTTHHFMTDHALTNHTIFDSCELLKLMQWFLYNKRPVPPYLSSRLIFSNDFPMKIQLLNHNPLELLLRLHLLDSILHFINKNPAHHHSLFQQLQYWYIEFVFIKHQRTAAQQLALPAEGTQVLSQTPLSLTAIVDVFHYEILCARPLPATLLSQIAITEHAVRLVCIGPSKITQFHKNMPYHPYQLIHSGLLHVFLKHHASENIQSICLGVLRRFADTAHTVSIHDSVQFVHTLQSHSLHSTQQKTQLMNQLCFTLLNHHTCFDSIIQVIALCFYNPSLSADLSNGTIALILQRAFKSLLTQVPLHSTLTTNSLTACLTKLAQVHHHLATLDLLTSVKQNRACHIQLTLIRDSLLHAQCQDAQDNQLWRAYQYRPSCGINQSDWYNIMKLLDITPRAIRDYMNNWKNKCHDPTLNVRLFSTTSHQDELLTPTLLRPANNQNSAS